MNSRHRETDRIALTLAFLAMITAIQTGVVAASEPLSMVTSAETQVRAARLRFNAAIASQDMEAVDGLFAPDYHLITGRGDQFHGRDAHIELWRDTFRSDPGFNCQRTPEEVIVNADWGLAQETGRWICSQTVEGMPGRYSGVYAAKWQRAEDSEWLLQSEVFTTLTCEGPEAACRPPDPVAR